MADICFVKKILVSFIALIVVFGLASCSSISPSSSFEEALNEQEVNYQKVIFDEQGKGSFILETKDFSFANLQKINTVFRNQEVELALVSEPESESPQTLNKNIQVSFRQGSWTDEDERSLALYAQLADLNQTVGGIFSQNTTGNFVTWNLYSDNWSKEALMETILPITTKPAGEKLTVRIVEYTGKMEAEHAFYVDKNALPTNEKTLSCAVETALQLQKLTFGKDYTVVTKLDGDKSLIEIGGVLPSEEKIFSDIFLNSTCGITYTLL